MSTNEVRKHKAIFSKTKPKFGKVVTVEVMVVNLGMKPTKSNSIPIPNLMDKKKIKNSKQCSLGLVTEEPLMKDSKSLQLKG